jgi:hypothetical protein
MKQGYRVLIVHKDYIIIIWWVLKNDKNNYMLYQSQTKQFLLKNITTSFNPITRESITENSFILITDFLNKVKRDVDVDRFFN